MPQFNMTLDSVGRSSDYKRTIEYRQVTAATYIQRTVFSEPITRYSEQTLIVPNEIDLYTIKIINVTANFSSGGDTGNYTSPDVNEIKRRLENKESSFEVRFYFQATRPSDTGWSGEISGTAPTNNLETSITKTHYWNNIVYTVTYEYLGKVTGTISIPTAATITYNFMQDSLAGQEQIEATFTIKANSAITSGVIGLYVGDTPPTNIFSSDKKIDIRNMTAEETLTIKIDELSIANHIQGTIQGIESLKIAVIITKYGRVDREINDFHIATTRPAPTITSITISDDAYATFSAFLIGQSSPVYTINANANKTLTQETKIEKYKIQIMKEDTSVYDYESNNNIITIPKSIWNNNNFSNGDGIIAKVTVTDNFNTEKEIEFPDNPIPTIEYTQPTITNYRVVRYTHETTPTEQDVETPLGNRLCLFATLNWDNFINTVPNNFHIKVYDGRTNPIYSRDFGVDRDINPGEYSYKFNDGTGKNVFGNTEYPSSNTYTIKIVFYDDVLGDNNKITVITYAVKGTAYLDVEKHGVAIGMMSTGTIESPLFQVDYPAELHSIVKLNGKDYDTNWEDLSSSGNPNYIQSTNRIIKLRRVGNIVQLLLNIQTINDQSASIDSTHPCLIMELPENFHPSIDLNLNYYFPCMSLQTTSGCQDGYLWITKENLDTTTYQNLDSKYRIWLCKRTTGGIQNWQVMANPTYMV